MNTLTGSRYVPCHLAIALLRSLVARLAKIEIPSSLVLQHTLKPSTLQIKVIGIVSAVFCDVSPVRPKFVTSLLRTGGQIDFCLTVVVLESKALDSTYRITLISSTKGMKQFKSCARFCSRYCTVREAKADGFDAFSIHVTRGLKLLPLWPLVQHAVGRTHNAVCNVIKKTRMECVAN